MKDKYKGINSDPFLGALAILLVNDFYLKYEFSNWITGKLSDFSGLFVFSIFFATLLPKRKKFVFLLTGILFIVWKSPLSSQFIELFSLYIYPIHRVIDYSDLSALIVLPIAYFYNKPKSIIESKLSFALIFSLTIFSFLATSSPKPTITFKHTQYVLLKWNAEKKPTFSHELVECQVFDLDSQILVQIDEIEISRKPDLDDEYHKKQVLSMLDNYLIKDYNDANDSFLNYDSIIAKGFKYVKVKTPYYVDHLNFKDSRLHGDFKRFSNTNKLLINGEFKNGIEDSIWTYYNDSSAIISQDTYKDGELIEVKKYDGLIVVSNEKFDTREETIIKKTFIIVVIGLAIASLIFILVQLYKEEKNARITLRGYQIFLLTLIMPMSAIILGAFISNLIPNSFNLGLGLFVEIILVYFLGVPTCLFIFYQIRLRNTFDILIYIFLISLCIVFIEELIYLQSIKI